MQIDPKGPVWQKVPNVQNLYVQRDSGIYHSRFRMNGQRTFRSLKTKVETVAKLKHAKAGVNVERDRQRGAELATDFATLGGLWREMQRRLNEQSVAKNTEVGRRNNMLRLRDHWCQGVFDTFPATHCDHQTIIGFREHLLKRAKWRYHFQKVLKVGFGKDTVNQTLWVLRVMLDIAVEQSVIPENPFVVTSVLRDDLYCTTASRNGRRGAPKKQALYIPEVADMNRIFDEIARLPVSERFNPNPEQRAYLERMAREMSDHAQLIAFSGMRLRESWASTLADDRGTMFKIWGTKSESSDRLIDMNPALREVIDRIKTRRIGANTKMVVSREPMKAMNRACMRLGLPKLTNHRLRHFFASVCIAQGTPVPTVSAWLGHADGGALCMATYGHLLRSQSQEAAQRLDFKGGSGTAAQSRIA